MASIFLSYSHEDAKRAQRLVRALQEAGHHVWYDQHIHAGRRFSKDIDNALKAADMVVVLWSKASIESAWVQDEAAYGRDRGRLVPVLLDKIDPPLGFRQYQAISMRGGSAGPVVNAVGALLSDKVPLETPSTKGRKRGLQGWFAAAVFLFLLGAGGWLFYRQSLSGQPALSIEPAKGTNSPIAAMVTQDLLNSMHRFKAGPVSTLEILPPGSNGNATYQARLIFAEDERQVSLNLALDHKRDGRLWSLDLQGPPHNQAGLIFEMAGRLGSVLACDLDVRKRNYEISRDVRALYLEGCSRMGDLSTNRDEQAINAFRQATQKAPKFAPAWAHLAYAHFTAIGSAPSGQGKDVAWTAGRYNRMAQRLDPSLPEPYFVEAFDRRSFPGMMAEALGIIDDGLRRNDDSALLFDARSTIMANLGLLRLALESSKRALDLEPLSPTYLRNYAILLAYTGQTQAARNAIDEAQRNWPRSAALAEIRFMFDFRYGDANNAMRLIRNGEAGPINPDEGMQLYLQARISPTPANVDALIRYYRLQFEKNPENSFHYIQALGTAGRVDEAYSALLGKPEAIDPFTTDGEGLFRPYMRKMRDDPRFIDIAYRAGMLTYWRKTDLWPDFCKDPKLPYDCRREAAKYPLELPKSPN